MDKIDIILATHNKIEMTIHAVQALYNWTKVPFRLIVIDDSTDGGQTELYFKNLKKEMGEEDNVTFVHSKEQFKNGNQIINKGMKEANGEVVTYLGNSTWVEPEWLEAGISMMDKEEDVAIMGFKLVRPNGTLEHAGIYWTPDMPHHYNYGANEAAHRYTHIREVDIVGFALCLLRKSAFPDGLDEKSYNGFAGYDDLDNCLSAKKRGWRILYCGLGTAIHLEGATRSKGSDEYATKVEENRQTFLNRWGGTDKAKGSAVMDRVIKQG